MTRVSSALLALLAIAWATGALAHASPRAEAPAANAVIGASPPEVRITFSESLAPSFSGMEVKDQAGRSVETGPVRIGPGDKRQMAVSVRRPLAPGLYTVSWHAVAADTHRTAGHYSFRVRP